MTSEEEIDPEPDEEWRDDDYDLESYNQDEE